MTKTLHFKIMLRAALFFTVIISSCKKDKNVLTANAVVINSCGWKIKLNDTTVLWPQKDLEDKFRQDNLPVVITYHLLTRKLGCPFTDTRPDAPLYTEIDLVTISK